MIANLMRQKTAHFELALKQYEHDEEILRAETLPLKLCSGKVVSFWSDGRNVAERARRLPQSIDQVSGEEEMFRPFEL